MKNIDVKEIKELLNQVETNKIYTAYCNAEILCDKCNNKKLKDKLIVIRNELKELINKNGNKIYKKDDAELKVVIEIIEDLARRM